MPNGNILAIAWEDKSEAEALQAGRNPAIASDAPGGNANVWPDHIIEIEPLANNQANIVWEWHAWDHLIQDYDASKDNYGVVSEHPELLDINFVGATGNQAGRADWMHCKHLGTDKYFAGSVLWILTFPKNSPSLKAFYFSIGFP